MKKNILCIVLTLVMVLSMLAGCSDKEGSTTPAASSAETTEPAAPETQTPTSADELSSVGVEPAEPNHTIEYPICDPGEITLTYWMQWPPFLNGQYEPGDVSFFAALEDITGVHLDITYCSTEMVADQLQLLTVSNSYCDLMSSVAYFYPGGGTKAIEDEMIIDMLPYMEENMPNYWAYMQDPAVSKMVINDQGYVPTLMGIYTDYFYTDQGLWVRQDWLDDLNMDQPETIDEFTDMLKTFKSEKGASEPLTVLASGSLEPLATSFGFASVFVDDGTVVYGDVTDSNKEYLSYLHGLYEEGLISSDFVSYTQSQTKPPEDVVLNGKTGVFNEDVASITSYTNNVEGMELRALPAPLQEAGEKLKMAPKAALAATLNTLSVAESCEYKEEALQFLDYLFSEDGSVLANWGIEGETYDIIDGEKVFKDEILNDPLGFQISQLINICPGFVRMLDWDVTYLTYNEAQKEAVDIWMTAFESDEATFPRDYVTYTADESETMSQLESTIETYCEECRLKFIIGDMDLEKDWDNYVAEVENMGLDELMEIYQDAYERYEAK